MEADACGLHFVFRALFFSCLVLTEAWPCENGCERGKAHTRRNMHHVFSVRAELQIRCTISHLSCCVCLVFLMNFWSVTYSNSKSSQFHDLGTIQASHFIDLISCIIYLSSLPSLFQGSTLGSTYRLSVI